MLTERPGVTARAVRRRRLDRLDARALEHDHQAARLWALLAAHRPRTRVTGFRWEAELSLRARKLRVRVPGPAADGSGGDGSGRGRALPFLPDGYAELDYPDGSVQCCVFEVDRGTQPLRKFARKLAAFEALVAEGRIERHFGRETFEVLALAPTLPPGRRAMSGRVASGPPSYAGEVLWRPAVSPSPARGVRRVAANAGVTPA
jgi:hypothetical protein